MSISTFDDLFTAARAALRSQRLLFVSAAEELTEDATEAPRANFERGQGGTLVPQMCVDKAQTSADADQPLERMVEAIKQGRIGDYIPFDPQGQTVQIG